MSTSVCKNCNAVLTGPYCNQCGQKASIPRITLKSLWHEIIHSLTHIEKGFFYTTIGLFIYPGRIINGYLSGKTVKLHRPLGLYFIWIGIVLLLDNVFKKEIRYEPLSDISPEATLYEPLKAVYPIYEQYLAFLNLPFLLIACFIIYLFVSRKLNYNYAETIILGIYISTASFVFSIFVQMFGTVTGTYSWIQAHQLNFIIPGVFQLWTLFDTLKWKPYWESFLIVLLINLINYTLFFCYLRYAVPFVVNLFM